MQLIQPRQKAAKPATTQPDTEQTAAMVAQSLAQLERERQSLTDERSVIDEALADVLAARAMGGRSDAAELVALTERRDANEAEAGQLDLTIAGMRSRLAELQALEAARRTSELRPQLETVSNTGERLIERYYRQLLELAATVSEIEANTKTFDAIGRQWDKASPQKGHGIARPRDVFGLDPSLLYRCRASLGVVTLQDEIERWYTEPERHAEARARELAVQIAKAEDAKAREDAERQRHERQFAA